MSNQQFDALSPGMRDCLRLVLSRNNSKEIARELGISHHTVDKRLERATAILGANSRFDAARKLGAYEGEPYERFVYEPSDVELRQPLKSNRFRWPVRSPGETRNDLTIFERIAWIVALTIGIAISTGMLLAGADALGRLTWALTNKSY